MSESARHSTRTSYHRRNATDGRTFDGSPTELRAEPQRPIAELWHPVAEPRDPAPESQYPVTKHLRSPACNVSNDPSQNPLDKCL